MQRDSVRDHTTEVQQNLFSDGVESFTLVSGAMKGGSLKSGAMKGGGLKGGGVKTGYLEARLT